MYVSIIFFFVLSPFSPYYCQMNYFLQRLYLDAEVLLLSMGGKNFFPLLLSNEFFLAMGVFGYYAYKLAYL